MLRDGSSNDLLSGDIPHAWRIYITSSHILQHISNVLPPAALSLPPVALARTHPQKHSAEGGEQRVLILLWCWCQSQARHSKFRSTATGTINS